MYKSWQTDLINRTDHDALLAGIVGCVTHHGTSVSGRCVSACNHIYWALTADIPSNDEPPCGIPQVSHAIVIIHAPLELTPSIMLLRIKHVSSNVNTIIPGQSWSSDDCNNMQCKITFNGSVITCTEVCYLAISEIESEYSRNGQVHSSLDYLTRNTWTFIIRCTAGFHEISAIFYWCLLVNNDETKSMESTETYN